MPVVTPRKAVSTLDAAKAPEDLKYETYRIKGLLSSKSSGDGKTSSAITIPGKKLVIDIDHRSESVAGFPGVHILRWEGKDRNTPEHWMWLEQVKKDLWSLARHCSLKKEPFPWDGIIPDGNTALFRVCMAWSLTLDPKRGLGGSPAEHHWMPQMVNASNWINSLIGLPCHVIFTGHEDLIEGKNGELDSYLPKVTGKLRTEVSKWFNETYFCRKLLKKETPKGEKGEKGEVKIAPTKATTRYYWYTDKVPRRDYLKSSMNQLSKYWDGPIEIDFSKEFCGFEDLLVRRFGDVAKEDILKKREVIGGRIGL